MAVDFGLTAQDYAQHRAGFPPAFFERVGLWGVGRPGQHLCDLGTGTGTLARGFAKQGCHVIGVDPSEPMLEQARALASTADLRVTFRTGRAEETGLPSQSFDVVSAGQCWHWFDRPRAATEVRRILLPGGVVLLAHLDWLPLPDSVIEATEFLLHTVFPDAPKTPADILGHSVGIYPAWFQDLTMAGFTGLESFSFDCTLEYTHESWRGRVRASASVGASRPAEERDRFDRELDTLLRRKFPSPQFSVPHRVFALMARAPLAT